ncbi:MAG: alpha/beta hydrolase [Myxococcota bacterium]|nr:alpha/beta hydrolase [Myxococcota bacterium]
MEERFSTLPSGVEICWEERGEGSPIVLVMGIGAQLILWPDGLCDALAARGHRVIRFDNRDVGRSSHLHHLGVPPMGRTLLKGLLGQRVAAPYALEDMAHDLAHLMDALGLPDAHVVGASMGGMIAQTFAFLHPDRVRSLVSMMSTTGKPGLLSEPKALGALFQAAPRTKDEAVERNVKLFRVIRSTGYDFDEAWVRDTAAASWDRGFNPRGFLRHLGAIGATGDRTARLRFVHAPTLVVHGTVDPLIRPWGGRATAEAIPGAELWMVDGMGHDFPPGLWEPLADRISAHARRAEG